MHDNPWKTIGSKYTHENRWFKVRTDAVITPGGQQGEYNVIEIPPPVGIVALNDKNEICLIKEFRYPHQLWIWEVPMGAIDASDADPLVAAKRELKEETGYTSENWEAVGTNYGIKGVTNQIVHTFLARDIVPGKSQHEGIESIEGMRFVSFKDFFAEVRDGSIKDAETITAVTQAAVYLGLL